MIPLDRTSIPSTWPLPEWMEKHNSTKVPQWLVQWSQHPCDLLFLGPQYQLATLYILIKKFWPTVWIELVKAFDIKPYKNFELEKKYITRWGMDQPLSIPVVFITGINNPLRADQCAAIRGLIEARRGAKHLTIVHWLASLHEWGTKVKIDMPMVIRWTN